jgi:hypothetical protein
MQKRMIRKKNGLLKENQKEGEWGEDDGHSQF